MSLGRRESTLTAEHAFRNSQRAETLSFLSAALHCTEGWGWWWELGEQGSHRKETRVPMLGALIYVPR